MIGMILIPLGGSIGYLIWMTAQLVLKVDIMWDVIGNHLGMQDELDKAVLRRRNGDKRT
jgi:hypothetical protein